jgi:hypothetical protein
MTARRFATLAATAALFSALAVPAFAANKQQGRFDPFSEGARASYSTFTDGARAGKLDTFTEGARMGRFDPNTEGARSGKFDPTTEGM